MVIVEAVAPPFQNLDFVVNAFRDTVGDMIFKECQDTERPSLDTFGQLDKGFQAALLATSQPAFEELVGVVPVRAHIEVGEVFLQQVCFLEMTINGHDLIKRLLVLASQIAA